MKSPININPKRDEKSYKHQSNIVIFMNSTRVQPSSSKIQNTRKKNKFFSSPDPIFFTNNQNSGCVFAANFICSTNLAIHQKKLAMCFFLGQNNTLNWAAFLLRRQRLNFGAKLPAPHQQQASPPSTASDLCSDIDAWVLKKMPNDKHESK